MMSNLRECCFSGKMKGSSLINVPRDSEKMAIEAGLTQEDMLSAIRVADAVREGAGKKNKDFTESLFGSIKEERCCPAGSACCA